MRDLIRQILFIIGTLALLVALTSCGRHHSDESKAIAEDKNDEKFDSKSGQSDAQFVVDAVSDGYGQLMLADVALQQSKDQEIKDVASMVTKEQSAALTDLKRYASSKAISIPTEATDADQKKSKNIAGEKNFDKAWCEEMRTRHRKTIDGLENAAATTSDNDLKNWANHALKIARADHDKIMACHERLK